MRGAIYARYSTARQNQRSVEDQTRICRNYAERNGIEIVAVYTDKERSGYSSKREGLQRLLEDARAKKFDMLLVEHTSRLSRDGLELRKLIKEFQKLRITIIFVSQNLRTDRDEDLALIKLLNIVDEQYIEAIKIATRRGLEGALLRGKWVSSAPYGYKLENGELKINEEEAKFVKEIFERYANGEGLRLICYSLNERGIKPRRARSWSTSTLSYMLRRPIYKGELVWGLTKRIEDEKVTVIPNPKEPIKIKRPDLAIVSEEVWEKVNKRLEENKGKGKHRKIRHIHPLAGVIICGHCGNPLGKERNRLICYTHRSKKACDFDFRIDYNAFLYYFTKLLKEFIKENKDEILRHIRKLKEGVDYSSEIQRLENKLEKLIELYMENPSDVLKKKINELTKQIAEIREKSNRADKFDFELALENLDKVMELEPALANQVLKTFIGVAKVYKVNDAVLDLKLKPSEFLATILQKVVVSRAEFSENYIMWLKMEEVKNGIFVEIERVF